jgi:hypothetical protein
MEDAVGYAGVIFVRNSRADERKKL